MEKINNKNRKLGRIALILVVIAVFSITISLVYAQTWPAFNVCCEKTVKGAWCQNTLESNCKDKYRETPTSCEATSFCKLGCCVDSEEGLCMKNTPQKVCEVSTGSWIDDENCEVPQCSLGCCVLGDQASFVTLTRCKRLSGMYGLETNFKRDINSEAECIAIAYSQDRGACVYESEAMKTCRLTTRASCLNSEKTGNVTSEPEFFNGYLCSADELATDCGPTTETTCVEGKDEVYFKDSCGNPANIYNANKVYSKNPSYWQKIVSKDDSCGAGRGNINSRECGNCEYLRGSICGKGNAVKGDYVCKDLNCKNTKNGKSYKNGESWCVYQGKTGKGKDVVGSRHFRHICIQGEEIVEPCADFRNEVCFQDNFKTSGANFVEAACRINRWNDCINQFEKEDCLNTDKRECFWKEDLYYDGNKEGQNETNVGDLGNEDEEKMGIIKADDADQGICLPENPPGLEFWNKGDSGNVCSLGNSRQIVYYETNLFGKRKCKENCDALTQTWLDEVNGVCRSLGDCGNYINIADKFTDDGIVMKVNGKRKKIVNGILEKIEENAED